MSTGKGYTYLERVHQVLNEKVFKKWATEKLWTPQASYFSQWSDYS